MLQTSDAISQKQDSYRATESCFPTTSLNFPHLTADPHLGGFQWRHAKQHCRIEGSRSYSPNLKLLFQKDVAAFASTSKSTWCMRASYNYGILEWGLALILCVNPLESMLWINPLWFFILRPGSVQQESTRCVEIGENKTISPQVHSPRLSTIFWGLGGVWRMGDEQGLS